MPPTLVRVFYPTTNARVVLRTDADWNAVVEPLGPPEGGTCWSFAVESSEPFFYFKPCLVDPSGDFRWSVGANYLAVASVPGPRDAYPYFFEQAGGHITDAVDVADSGHRVRVYRPPGYDENTLKHYPVLYMQDGANIFFKDEAFLGRDWEVDETLDLLDSMNLVHKVLVVGIYAGDRMREYTRPGYQEYADGIVGAIKPLVDRSFRTLPGPATTAVMGSSLGGVVSFYLGWQRPDVFGMAACLSSTFGYRDDLFERVAREPKRNVRFYLDSGWPRDNYEATQAMRDLLIHRGYEPGRDLLYFAFPGQSHDERAWAGRIHLPFQFFFGKTYRR